MYNIILTLILTYFTTSVAMGLASAREQIRIVGSSTVYPFTTIVAEKFGKSTPFKTPIVESTGSGGGMKIFCSGTSLRYADVTNASRRIKKKEFDMCQRNGVRNILEVKVGYDGIVIANSRSSKRFGLSLRDIFLALAKEVPTKDGKAMPNPYRTWKQINPMLPATKIEVLGPPPTSGTRDAFVELAMEGGCKTFKWIKALKHSNKMLYKSLCHTIREDGVYIEAGENDNMIIHKLTVNPHTLGIFGFSFLDMNGDKIQGSIVHGHKPTFENIASGKYPVSRPLYFYVKKSSIGLIRGLRKYVDMFISDRATGPDGYLTDYGLIPLGDAEREQRSKAIMKLQDLSM